MSDIKINRLIGEFIGTLEGIMFWDIPIELKEKLQKKVDELKSIPIHSTKTLSDSINETEIFKNEP